MAAVVTRQLHFLKLSGVNKITLDISGSGVTAEATTADREWSVTSMTFHTAMMNLTRMVTELSVEEIDPSQSEYQKAQRKLAAQRRRFLRK